MAQEPSDPHQDLANLAASVRAHIEAEIELGADGLSAWQGTLQASDSAAEAPAPVPPAHVALGELAPATAAAAVAATVAPEDRHRRLDQLKAEAATCTACVLHEGRTRSVFARGAGNSGLAFVGEGPGYEEDVQGLPFVGPAGQLLDRMIDAMGFERDEVYVCNIVKCRPPENRTPRPEEASACSRFLVPQLELMAPKIIVALGRCAAENLGVAQAGGAWRGRWGSWRGVPVMPTYHPAYLLRSPEQKRVVWEDLQQVSARFGRSPKTRSRSNA